MSTEQATLTGLEKITVERIEFSEYTVYKISYLDEELVLKMSRNNVNSAQEFIGEISIINSDDYEHVILSNGRTHNFKVKENPSKKLFINDINLDLNVSNSYSLGRLWIRVITRVDLKDSVILFDRGSKAWHIDKHISYSRRRAFNMKSANK